MSQNSITDIKRNLADVEVSPEPELLGGYFPRGQVSVVASKPGTGKTWLMLLLAKKMSESLCTCTILNGECGIGVLAQRVKLLQWNLPHVGVYDLSESLSYGGLMLDDKSGWENITKICKADATDCLYVDSLVSFMNADESELRGTRSVLARLLRLATTLDIAIVLNHHLRKSSSEQSSSGVTLDDVIGSSAISRIACNVYGVKAGINGSGATLTCLKTWYRKPQDLSFRLVLDEVKNKLVMQTSDVGPKQAGVRELVCKTLLQEHEPRTAEELAELSGLPLRSCQRALTGLVSMGSIKRSRVQGINVIKYVYEVPEELRLSKH